MNGRPLRVCRVGYWWVVLDAGGVLPRPMVARTWVEAMRMADMVARAYRRNSRPWQGWVVR